MQERQKATEERFGPTFHEMAFYLACNNQNGDCDDGDDGEACDGDATRCLDADGDHASPVRSNDRQDCLQKARDCQQQQQRGTGPRVASGASSSLERRLSKSLPLMTRLQA